MKQIMRLLYGILLSLILLLGVLTVPAIADYTVEFTRGELQYVLPGNGSQQLSVILDKVGLVGEVTDVSVSNEGLFSVSHEAGEWIVDSHQAFKTTEWMRVTVGGVEYEITVTDDPGSAYAGTDVKDLTPTSQEWSFCDSYIYGNSYYYLTSGAYYIDKDVTIDRPLMVAQGNTVTLNLNGNTLTGNSSDSVIVVAGGTLTVNDGTITGGQGNEEIRYGGWSRGGGLAVDFYSNVTLNDVVITGNSAAFGGGIFIHGPGVYSGDPANVTLNRCTVTGNSGDGAGVFFDGGNLTVNDSVISGNTGWGMKVGAQCNGVFLKGDSVIYGNTSGDIHIGGTVGSYGSLQGVSVIGELGSNAKFGINMENPNVFTDSVNTSFNDPSKFVSSSADWISVKNTDGQLMLVEASKVKVKTTDFVGPYDGKPHTINYTIQDDDNAKPKFGTAENNCSSTVPPYFSNYGIHPVYYQINIETTAGTYVPIVGAASVNIQAVVSFDHGNGSGTMDSVNVNAGSLYTLPDSSFIPPENVVGEGEFGWRSSADNKLYAPSDKVTVNENTTFTAQWTNPLDAAKAAAKAELETLLQSKNEADYDSEDWTALNQAIADGKTTIDNATTIDDVDTAKNDAINAVNAIKTKAEKAAEDLDAAKAAAKAELDTLLQSKNEADYDAEDWIALNQAITDGKTAIDNATTTDAVDIAKRNAVDAVNAVKTTTEKKEEVDTAAADMVRMLIDALPKAEDVKLSDKDAIDAARKAYDALTEDQKMLISAETLKHLMDDEDALKDRKATYVTYAGEGGQYRQGSDGTLTFVFKRSEADESTFNRFTGLKYDGQLLTKDRHYTAMPGSVIITLDHDFLESLEVGQHILTAEFDDGLADAHFTVIAKDEPTATPTATPTVAPTPTPTPKPTATPKPVPRTGDSAPLALWIGLILVGVVYLSVFVAKRRGTQKK